MSKILPKNNVKINRITLTIKPNGNLDIKSYPGNNWKRNLKVVCKNAHGIRYDTNELNNINRDFKKNNLIARVICRNWKMVLFFVFIPFFIAFLIFI